MVEYYGTPAIASTKQKRDPNLPIKHWWITEPVAEAIVVAEQLSDDPDRVFAPIDRKDDSQRVHGANMLDSFIRHVNATREWTGLEAIPAGKVRPHMFRRTMAMLTDQFAGSEIALGIQLKHVATRALANRCTRGYAASDAAWAEHLDSAIEAAPLPPPGRPLPGTQSRRSARLRTRRRAHGEGIRRHSRDCVGPWRGRRRREGTAAQGADLHPVRHPQPLRLRREQPNRRALPRERDHPTRTHRAAAGPMPTRSLRQQHHRPGTRADLGRREAHPPHPSRHTEAAAMPQGGPTARAH